MTEDPNSAAVGTDATNRANAAVGADKIDAYIDSVERVLLTACVAKSERLQILEDLEQQISEMLAKHPLPLSEETVEQVLAALEPPSHFAAIYGTESEQSRPPVTTHTTTIPYNPWVIGAAVSCALVPLSCLLLMGLAAGRAVGPAVFLVVLLLLAGIIATPIALRKGFAQLRAEPLRHRGRDLAIATTSVYAATVPLLLLVFAAAATDGYILFPVGVASFVYFQWLLVRRLQQRIVAAIPTQPTTDSLQSPLWRFIRPAQAAPCA